MTPAEAAESATQSVPHPSGPRPKTLVGFPEVADLVDGLNRSVWAEAVVACKELRRATTRD